MVLLTVSIESILTTCSLAVFHSGLSFKKVGSITCFSVCGSNSADCVGSLIVLKSSNVLSSEDILSL